MVVENKNKIAILLSSLSSDYDESRMYSLH